MTVWCESLDFSNAPTPFVNPLRLSIKYYDSDYKSHGIYIATLIGLDVSTY